MNICALITARSGSKGVPGKNIKTLAKKPLIAWTIQSAHESSVFDRIIISTDDEEIAKISRFYEAEVPFKRPRKLAMDDSPHIDVVAHAIEWLHNKNNYYPEYVMLLQPTSPLRTDEDIKNAVEIAKKHKAASVISVSPTPVHPYLMKEINEKGILSSFVEIPNGYLRRQLYPKIYYVNGAIYLIKTEVLLQQKTFFPDNTYPCLMSVENSLDIDTTWDFYLGNLILQDKLGKDILKK